MTPDGGREPFRRKPRAGEVVPDLRRDLAAAGDAANGLDRDHRGEPGPVREGGERREVGAGEDPPPDQAAVAVVERVEARPQPGPTHEISRLKAALKRGARAYRNGRGGGQIANLQCVALGCSCTASSLTAPRALIPLISCVGPGRGPGRPSGSRPP